MGGVVGWGLSGVHGDGWCAVRGLCGVHEYGWCGRLGAEWSAW